MWHLLSLDAPTVAALWVWFIARCCHMHLPFAAPACMFLAVWILYAADRLLDGARPRACSDLEERHLFHRHYARRFIAGIALTSAVLACLLHSLDAAAVWLYLIEGSLLLIWLAALHSARNPHRRPKEIAVGLFFSAAVFIPTVARDPGLRAELAPAAMLFAAICSLNCLFIYAWEHARTDNAHATTRFALAGLPEISIVVAAAAIAVASLAAASARPIAIACALAALFLLALHVNRSRFSANDLRAAADLALLTPVLVLPWLR
jgi:hypothetical protein